jgi:positive regulator of sigma E activity
MTDEHSVDTGIVTHIQGKKITVEIAKGGGCKSCSMHGLCGTNSTPIVLSFITDAEYQIGDKVNVSVGTNIKLLSSVIVYLLPLVALFAFFLIARSFMQELGAVLCGFIGLILSFLLIRVIDKKIGKHINFELGGKSEDMPE